MSTPRLYRFLLEDGREVAASGEEQAAAIHLQKLGIITIKNVERIYCYHEDDDDYLIHSHPDCNEVIDLHQSGNETEDELTCEQCGNVIRLEEKRRHSFLVLSLNEKGSLRYLSQRFSSISASQFCFDTEACGTLVTEFGKVNVCLYEKTSDRHRSAGLNFLEAYLFVLMDARSERDFQLISQSTALGLWDLIAQDDEALRERTNQATTHLSPTSSYKHLNQKFDAMLEQGWSHFEQTLVPALLRHIAGNPTLVSQYLTALKRVTGTLFGSLVVPTGGAGKTDIRLLSKYELLQGALLDRTIFDAKKHTKKTLSRDEVERVRSHLEDDITEPARAVIAVSSDDITSTAWEMALNYKRLYGHQGREIVILPRTLLIEIIFYCRAESLLELLPPATPRLPDPPRHGS